MQAMQIVTFARAFVLLVLTLTLVLAISIVMGAVI